MKTRSTFSLIFWVNTSRIKNEHVPIYARITVDGKRANFSLQRRIAIAEWDSERGIVKGTREQARLTNKYLDQIRSKVYQAYEDLLSENKFITAQAIRSKFLGEDKLFKTLTELFEYHNEISKESLSAHTIRHYKVTQGYLMKFIKEKHKKDDLRLIDLNYSFIIDFEFFIKSYEPKDHQKKMGHNTAMKHLQRLLKMVTMAYHHEWIAKDPFVRFKTSFQKNRREYLTKDELQKIEDFNSSLDRLNIVKDLFLFSCYTGLSYIDMTKLSIDNIQMDLDGKQWIKTNRQKTKIELKIPLLTLARKILLKYQDHPRSAIKNTLLPVYSNQKINSYLKEISDFCGITKNLTFHVARHTRSLMITEPAPARKNTVAASTCALTVLYAAAVWEKAHRKRSSALPITGQNTSATSPG